MKDQSRRDFVSNVSKGMLITGLGPGLANQLGISTSFASEGSPAIDFGDLAPLVHLMQDKPGEKLQPILVDRLKSGKTDLRRLVAAAALANAETFGGEDYVGFHTEMALVPALRMSRLLPEAERPLPVLKVIYRNADRIQGVGGTTKKTLKRLHGTTPEQLAADGESLRAATRTASMGKAEQIFSKAVTQSIDSAYNDLQYIIQDDINVHRFVLGHRIRELIPIVGEENAHTILRQSVRFCVVDERRRIKDGRPESPIRALVPKLLDQHKLLEKEPGTKQPGDGLLEELAILIYNSEKAQATDAVAAALAEGINPEAIGQAISLASNQLVLRQNKGRAHGASRGVHGSDAVNAWRNMARITNWRNTVVGLLVAAYHTAEYAADPAVKGDPLPHEEHSNRVTTTDPGEILKETEAAIRANNQELAAATVHKYGYLGHPEKPVFDLMLKYAISEDGRLHAEKYFQTVSEEFLTTNQAFRWRQLVAMARVTASAYGYTVDDKPGHRAPGYEQARSLLSA